MEGSWRTEKLLWWGKTYPDLSRKYTETVCSGAVFLDRPGLLRIYPVDYRYLPESNQPKKWSIITAQIKPGVDGRPESYRINAESIRVIDQIGTDNGWELRRKLMFRKEHMVNGIEDMERRQELNGQSIGITPVEVVDVKLERLTAEERKEHRKKYEEITSQQVLWPAGTKPMPAPQYKPRFFFRTPGDTQVRHRVCLDWEVIQGAHRFRDEADPEKAFKDFLFTRYLTEDHEPHMILGNLARFRHTFIIVGLMYPKKQLQHALF